jgi:hypothetical protein
MRYKRPLVATGQISTRQPIGSDVSAGHARDPRLAPKSVDNSGTQYSEVVAERSRLEIIVELRLFKKHLTGW